MKISFSSDDTGRRYFRQNVEGMKDNGVCIAVVGREEHEKSSSKAVKSAQEMTTSSLEEKEREERRNGQQQEDEITRGTPPNKKEA